MSAFPLRQMGTVIDKEVAIASIAQGLAPAGAAPPLMLSTLERKAPGSSGSGMYVGAPLKSRSASGAPLRAAREESATAKAFSSAEVKRRVTVGGFAGVQGSTLPLAAMPEGPLPWLGQQRWAELKPQLPAHVAARQETLRPYDIQAPAAAKLAAANVGMGGGSNGESTVRRM